MVTSQAPISHHSLAYPKLLCRIPSTCHLLHRPPPITTDSTLAPRHHLGEFKSLSCRAITFLPLQTHGSTLGLHNYRPLLQRWRLLGKLLRSSQAGATPTLLNLLPRLVARRSLVETVPAGARGQRRLLGPPRLRLTGRGLRFVRPGGLRAPFSLFAAHLAGFLAALTSIQ